MFEKASQRLSSKKMRLNYLISIELIVFQLLMLLFNPYVKLLPFFIPNFLASLLIISNIIILKKYETVQFSGYFLTLIFYLLVLYVNFLVGGADTTVFFWFYTIPVIAAATVGITGLIVFGAITLTTLLLFVFFLPPPILGSEIDLDQHIKMIDYSFILLLIVTVLITLLRELKKYELSLITDHKAVKFLSKHDPLTSLPNRSYFFKYLKQSIEALKPDEIITIYYMDFDNFKKINDQYGHLMGDSILKKTSGRIVNCFREQDFVARVGGDEFVSIVKHDENEAFHELITNRVRQTIHHPLRSNTTLSIDVSIGHASTNETKDIETLINLADRRMYQNKESDSE